MGVAEWSIGQPEEDGGGSDRCIGQPEGADTDAGDETD